jgi:hypothetical protein
MSFRIVPFPVEIAESVRRTRSDGFGNVELPAIVVKESPGTPCRVCLRDADVGERVLLFSHAPLAQAGPYRAVGPVYVHAEPCQPYAGGAVPEMLRRRLLSLRAFDRRGRMVASDVVEGTALESLAERLLGDEDVRTIHVHLARPGCFACAIDRAQ